MNNIQIQLQAYKMYPHLYLNKRTKHLKQRLTLFN